MKKLLLGAIALIAFSASLIITQISCQKDASAQIATGFTPPNLIVMLKLFNANDASTFRSEIWIAGIDGTGQSKVNVAIPSNEGITAARLNSDGTKVIFKTVIKGDVNQAGNVYACAKDGTNLTKIIDGSAGESIINLEGAY
jgi:tricorn protease-like protein